MENAKNLDFEWTSAAKDSARAAAPEMTFRGLNAVECVVRFAKDLPTEAIIVLYARGDAGKISETEFDSLVRTSCETLDKTTTSKFIVRGKDPTSAVKADGLIWNTPTARYLLEYSKTREVKSRNIPFRAEFVRLGITPPGKKIGLAAQISVAGKSEFIGSQHVKNDPATGDIWIPDVPMIDQGQKGYCVVAATERVMRYYGGSVDANELAQVANSSAQGGTSYEAMYESLKKLSARLKIRVREIEKSDIHDILKLISDYNREAKRAKAPLIPDQEQMIELDVVYRMMDLEIFRELRLKNKANLSRFQRSVAANIDKGTPPLWTVYLGKIPEKGIPQNAGGHMRLIIGYNSKTEEILYTDSWGAGHELKRMSAADAWTITTGMMSIEPI